jgi:diguanylate cyclase (GGDEF)-like protein
MVHSSRAGGETSAPGQIRRRPSKSAGDLSKLLADLHAAARPAPSLDNDDIASLKERIQLLQAVADNFPGGICMFDRDLNMVLSNDRLRELLDYSDALFARGNPTLEQIFRYNAERGEYGPGDVDEIVARRMSLVRQRTAHVYERTRPNGTVLEVRGVPLEGGGFLTIYVDVTEQHQRSRQLDAVVDNFPGGICMFDRDLNMVVCNRRLKEMLDYPDALFAAGNPTLEELIRYNASRGEYGPGDVEEHVRRRMALVSERRAHEYERVRPNGTVLEVRGTPVEGGGFVTTYADVTEKHRVQEHVAYLAHHDALTDLPNRLLLKDRLTQGLRQVKRGACLALHYLDLDRFKPVNDAFGHAVGDALLKAVAGRLLGTTREVDTVARIGGDEFVVMQTGLQHRSGAARLAGRLLAALQQDFDIHGHRIAIGSSIGIAFAPDDGTDPDQLLAKSDIALYAAKSDGRGRFVFAT